MGCAPCPDRGTNAGICLAIMSRSQISTQQPVSFHMKKNISILGTQCDIRVIKQMSVAPLSTHPFVARAGLSAGVCNEDLAGRKGARVRTGGKIGLLFFWCCELAILQNVPARFLAERAGRNTSHLVMLFVARRV